MTGRIVVIGDVMTDIMVVPQGPIATGTDVPATIRQMPGGSGANQAVWLAALGADVCFAARVGAGDVTQLVRRFEGAGVEARLGADQEVSTGTLVCIVNPDGERSFLTDRGANERLCADDLPPTLIDGVDRVHISGYALFSDTPREAILELCGAAREKQIPISLDPSSVGFLQAIGREAFLDCCKGIETLFPNADEAEFLTGTADPLEQIKELLKHFPRLVLKRGREGAIYADRTRAAFGLPAVETQTVDSTGAGDAFLAGFLAAHMRGEDERACLAAAIQAGSRAVAALGASPRQF